MSTPAASLEELIAVVRRLEAKVDAALKPAPKLLSKRQAAKILGVGRGGKLEALIRSGVIRQVLGKIPANEIDRLMTEGLPVSAKARASGNPTGEAREIGRIKLGDL